MINRHLLFAGK